MRHDCVDDAFCKVALVVKLMVVSLVRGQLWYVHYNPLGFLRVEDLPQVLKERARWREVVLLYRHMW